MRKMDVVFDGAFGGVGDEEVVVGEGVVVISSSLDMLTNEGIMVSLIFLEGLDEEALVEFMERDKLKKKVEKQSQKRTKRTRNEKTVKDKAKSSRESHQSKSQQKSQWSKSVNTRAKVNKSEM
ncbi:hypothetical protein Tco_1451366 [Tanacetum coccineum]